jgi:hypothetical protein
MTQVQLQTLLEVDEGEIHDFLCRRKEVKRDVRHQEVFQALE